MAIHITLVPQSTDLEQFKDPEGYVPTRTTDTAEDWGYDRDSREWMLFVEAAIREVRRVRQCR